MFLVLGCSAAATASLPVDDTGNDLPAIDDLDFSGELYFGNSSSVADAVALTMGVPWGPYDFFGYTEGEELPDCPEVTLGDEADFDLTVTGGCTNASGLVVEGTLTILGHDGEGEWVGCDKFSMTGDLASAMPGWDDTLNGSFLCDGALVETIEAGESSRSETMNINALTVASSPGLMSVAYGYNTDRHFPRSDSIATGWRFTSFSTLDQSDTDAQTASTSFNGEVAIAPGGGFRAEGILDKYNNTLTLELRGSNTATVTMGRVCLYWTTDDGLNGTFDVQDGELIDGAECQ
jgi:hypothetical protein